MKIEVVLRNLTPVHSSAPGKNTISIDGAVNTPNGMPFTRMRTMRVPVQTEDGILRTQHVPCIPSNTMRNALRRSMLNFTVFEQMRGHATLEIGAYAAACTGNASGNPEGVAASFDETMSIRNNVFLGLFGGGPRMIEGKLSVGTLFPIIKDTARIIGNGFEERMVGGHILDTVWVRRVDPIERISTDAPEKLISNGHSAIAEWSIKNMDIKSKASEKRSKTAKGEPSEEPAGNNARGLNAFNAHEVVIAGIDWLLNVNLQSPTQAQTGLVLKGLADIQGTKMQIGGGHAKDYGRFQIQDVTIDGKSVWSGDSYDFDAVAPYFDALANDLSDIKAEDFESFVKPSKAVEA
ncbi:type IV CRISPR-associated protein Csf2 [Pseudomonas luteola]